MGPTIPKEMKYNLHYGDVRGDVLPPPHGTNTSCSVAKQMPKAVLNVPVKRAYHFFAPDKRCEISICVEYFDNFGLLINIDKI